MIQGTTPTHVFELPIAPEDIHDLRLTYAQNGRVVMTKKKADLKFEEGENGYTAEFVLTQEETFRFDRTEKVEIQMRIMAVGGNVIASEIMRTSVGKCLGNEVIK